MDTQARLRYLREQWGINDLRVRGRLEKRQKDLWWLTDVRSESGKRLRYPLAELYSKPDLGAPGVFVGNESKVAPNLRESGTYVIVEVSLAPESERSKWKNPLLICADPTSIEPLTRIAGEHVHRNDDGSIDLEETLCRGYIDAQCAQGRDELTKLGEDIARLKQDHADVATRFHALRREREEAELARDQAQREVADAEAKSRRLAQEIEDGFAARREQLEKDARDREAALSRGYEEHERELRRELNAIEQELAAARKKRDREVGEIRSQTAALRSYVKSQIEPLHRLELITDTQWDALFPDAGNTPDQTREEWPEFDGETTQAIEHIQRYLFGRGIGYPWDLLANFHALLCTGDLIILSGLSGSGKTNLVKSYADATGNEARIVPVKPNWTSAEDLLGFHNPLQRAYAKTPFIEALFEASRDPERLYIVCLDEMNLARVEYYFVDFLSRLEDRAAPSIPLYPDDEAGHVLTELRVLMQTLGGIGLNLGSADLEALLGDGRTMTQLAERLGLGDGESFAQLHARVRRMLSGALTVPPQLQIPANVRFVGAVNMDDTTHYLSPKVLDRAHVLQFQSPLDYWDRVSNQIGKADRPTHGIRIPARAFPPRGEYPPYQHEDRLVLKLTEYGRDFLAPLGIELGMRPLRQAIHYHDQLKDLYDEGEGLDLLALNNLLRQKVFPRFSFDGKQSARGRGEQNRDAVARHFRDRLVEDLAPLSSPDGSLLFRASDDLAAMIERAKENDVVYNYWT
ncbi:AAA family ATPase [Thioalkalicoccus limnaeus]|uniref:AAA family ATPase n=1 Tax=Thioalkalicoccus limnaeus TaxID=120681 RepID=A0ABV4BBL4_9GAMM